MHRGNYSITSSARARREGGTARLMAYALPGLVVTFDRG